MNVVDFPFKKNSLGAQNEVEAYLLFVFMLFFSHLISYKNESVPRGISEISAGLHGENIKNDNQLIRCITQYKLSH